MPDDIPFERVIGIRLSRMLKKVRLLTRPTPAVISPTRPASAKTDSSPWDAPFPKQGRSEQPRMILPSLLVFVVPRMTWMSPPLRATFSLSHPLARRDVP